MDGWMGMRIFTFLLLLSRFFVFTFTGREGRGSGSGVALYVQLAELSCWLERFFLSGYLLTYLPTYHLPI
jgi:hypothetical protein